MTLNLSVTSTMTLGRFWMLLLLNVVLTVSRAESSSPNILIIVADDLGNGDLGCFGNSSLATPHVDGLASSGVKLTHNLAAYSLCTPSRASLLTGRYPVRSGMNPRGMPPVFALTASTSGLPATELTIGEVAKMAGYRTAFLGKWHLGWSVDRSDPDHSHPLNQGFDYFYGVPLTNMADFDGIERFFIKFNPDFPFRMLVTFTLALLTVACLARAGYVNKWAGFAAVALLGLFQGYVLFIVYDMKLLNSFMFRNYELVEQPIDLATVTRKMVLESQQFIKARSEDGGPFLLVVSWLHVHTAIATGPQFTGSSKHGPYGDAVQEMDWGIGQLLDTLQRYSMEDNTFVYFTSDHGAYTDEHDPQGNVVGGYNGPFWGEKGDGGTEGGIRVPGIVRWPARVPGGRVVDEPVSLLDLLPTLAHLLHVNLTSELARRHVTDSQPTTESRAESKESDTNIDHVTENAKNSHVIDGRSMVGLLTGEETVSPHEFLFHYCLERVHAVRYRPRTGKTVWKLALREPEPDLRVALNLRCQHALDLDPPRLYDLTSDPTANSPLDPGAHPEIRKAVLEALEEHLRSVTPVPSQFALHRIVWRPWLQPFCNFPTFRCQDAKFAGLFTDS